jgi:5-methylcytosine-specific restriction enzyme A
MFAVPSLCKCGRIVKRGEICSCRAKDAAERKARFDKKRPNSSQRGYDREWEREAKAFLALPGHQNCACGAPAVVVMHIKSIRQHPHLRMVKSNWRPGCQRCNAKEAAEERRILERNRK